MKSENLPRKSPKNTNNEQERGLQTKKSSEMHRIEGISKEFVVSVFFSAATLESKQVLERKRSLFDVKRGMAGKHINRGHETRN
ncbi:hypothetical protein MRB53_011606 [Persea americana]|uniref:Uncharacterized protein n=1 Tax=Persea americana TaxID=3435 RepID=A0ACC2LVF8_PERAE|nr:hypothetical protein MRB53_011606 [Persea americana]